MEGEDLCASFLTTSTHSHSPFLGSWYFIPAALDETWNITNLDLPLHEKNLRNWEVEAIIGMGRRGEMQPVDTQGRPIH